MLLTPASLEALAGSLADAHAGRRPVTTVDLSALAAVREHTPEDMTVTVEGGVNLAELQARLATRGQWLPIDPPHPDRVTIRELLADNLSGPRRCAFGTIREHLIGLEAVLPDGRIVHSGGKVVKNVAGYDLLKLFVGARDSLGIITAATFKLRPLPTVEQFASASFDTLAESLALVAAVQASALTPVALDLDNLQLVPGHPFRFTVFLAIAGSPEEVAWQSAESIKLGFPSAIPAAPMPGQAASPLPPLPRDVAFWSSYPDPVSRGSVLPSNLAAALAPLGQIPFIARAANGVFYHRSPPLPRSAAAPSALARRLKDTFDPHHILPELTL